MNLSEQLTSLSKGQILDIFRALNGGAVGFDHERQKKADCIHLLLGTYGEAKVSAVLNGDTAAEAAPTVEKVIAVGGPKVAPSGAVVTPVDMNAVANQIASLFATLAGSAVNEDKVKAIVDGAIADAVSRLVNRVELVTAEGVTVECGIQHREFPTLAKAVQAKDHDGHRLNVYLYGPAGTGKTTAAKLLAKAFNLPFRFNNALAAPHELVGFVDAGGNYRGTHFRDAYQNGGVYILDEVDRSSPSALIALNAALANGSCAFPDCIVERHPDFICIAGGNTIGAPSSDYAAANKQDAAFINRFVVIRWDIDEALELAICPNQEWARRVQGVRARVAQRGIRGHLVTPRASVYGAALLAQGLDIETVERMTLRGALSDEQWEQVR